MKETLFNALKRGYGADTVESHEGIKLMANAWKTFYIIIMYHISPSVPQYKLNENPHCNIVKVTILNEVGSLSRILNAFHVS
jgi:hypothetical protein